MAGVPPAPARCTRELPCTRNTLQSCTAGESKMKPAYLPIIQTHVHPPGICQKTSPPMVSVTGTTGRMP